MEIDSAAPIVNPIYSIATCSHKRRIRRISNRFTYNEIQSFKDKYTEPLANLWEYRLMNGCSLKIMGCFTELAYVLDIGSCYKMETLAFKYMIELFKMTHIDQPKKESVEIFKLLYTLSSILENRHDWDSLLYPGYTVSFISHMEYFVNGGDSRPIPYMLDFLNHTVSQCTNPKLEIIPLPSFWSGAGGVNILSDHWDNILHIAFAGLQKVDTETLKSYIQNNSFVNFLRAVNHTHAASIGWCSTNFIHTKLLCIKMLTFIIHKTSDCNDEILDRAWSNIDLKSALKTFIFDIEFDPILARFFVWGMTSKYKANDIFLTLLLYSDHCEWYKKLSHKRDGSVYFQDRVNQCVNIPLNNHEIAQIGNNIFELLDREGVRPILLDGVLKTWMDGKLMPYLLTKPDIHKDRFLMCNRVFTIPSECPICCSDENTMVIQSPCGHVFCIRCYSTLTCHICKGDVYNVVKQVYTT